MNCLNKPLKVGDRVHLMDITKKEADKLDFAAARNGNYYSGGCCGMCLSMAPFLGTTATVAEVFDDKPNWFYIKEDITKFYWSLAWVDSINSQVVEAAVPEVAVPEVAVYAGPKCPLCGSNGWLGLDFHCDNGGCLNGR